VTTQWAKRSCQGATSTLGHSRGSSRMHLSRCARRQCKHALHPHQPHSSLKLAADNVQRLQQPVGLTTFKNRRSEWVQPSVLQLPSGTTLRLVLQLIHLVQLVHLLVHLVHLLVQLVHLVHLAASSACPSCLRLHTTATAAALHEQGSLLPAGQAPCPALL
jgi:hypothetical protein